MTLRALLLLAALAIALPARWAEPLRIPGTSGYLAPDPEAVRMREGQPVQPFAAPASAMSWFGDIRSTGALRIAVAAQLPRGDTVTLRLEVARQPATQPSHPLLQATAFVSGTGDEGRIEFGAFDVADTGYYRFTLSPAGRGASPRTGIEALLLDGPAIENAHFNRKPRRNAASVHLRYATDSTWPVTGFYAEVTAVDDPVTTYYMATGFARGYFGMQVNSPTERRIIFSVWDAAEGANAKDRSTVAAENHVQLLAKGDGVEASVFGNEGTGGHSHLVYPWETGSVQRFFVTAEPNGTNTDYTGWWFHPDRREWMLIARFRAPKDGRYLRRLYSFSENFGGATGHLRRKALFGRQWIRFASGEWRELTEATFTHDVTGREDRLDRFMGVEDGRFFLSHGGFLPGFTASGTSFTRPTTGRPPTVNLPGR